MRGHGRDHAVSPVLAQFVCELKRDFKEGVEVWHLNRPWNNKMVCVCVCVCVT